MTSISRIENSWNAIPEQIFNALLVTSSGEDNLTIQANSLLDALKHNKTPEMVATLLGMVMSAWEQSIMSPSAAAFANAVHEQTMFLPPKVASFCAWVAALKPESESRLERLQQCTASNDIDAAKRMLERIYQQENQNPFWLRQAGILAYLFGELDWYESWLHKLPLPPGFANVLRAEYAFARSDWAAAAQFYAAAHEATGMTGWLAQQSECLRRMGQRDEAMAGFEKAFSERPWQLDLLLRLADLKRGADLPANGITGKGEILLYSWNHAADLNRALSALAESELYGYKITVLNNGSTDNTPEILSIWQDRLGDNLRCITLPVNVGAPAARNWLLSLDYCRSADWVIFLDDDAIVPPDWLDYFGKTMQLYPEAEILGCKVVDARAPLRPQSVDLHLDKHLESKFRLIEGHSRFADRGQYSYMRPATSVIGCCHLLKRNNIDAVGDFDLRFSPSQFDDQERDIRSCTMGRFCLYNGYLTVKHMKYTGGGTGFNRWLMANVKGNVEKMWASYTGEQIDAVIEKDRALLREDLQDRLRLVYGS
ncbi:glycosyltransferase [Desulfovibrio sp. OttesenSCG-928-C06]|nr:glycosyltransferase [Desulfovibrio sp. OttesenSCG-928-C06]